MRRTSTTALWGFNALVLIALGSLFYLYSTRQPLRVAYVDSTRLLDDYQGMVEARRTYARQRQEWKDNLDTLRKETSRGIAAYQKQRPQLTPAQRGEREAELRRKQQQFLEYQRVVQEQDDVVQRQITQPIVDSTNAFVRRYGKQQQYDLVLLTAEGDNVAYAKDGLDITVPVLKELNAKYQKQPPIK
jgi:outer membrane protein